MKRLLVLLCCLTSVGYAAIQTAGDLFIDINASASASAGNGAKLSSITNSGTLGGFFVRANANEGAIYTNTFGSVQHALWFNGNANTVMTNSVAIPLGLVSNTATYTIEAWVNNPSGVGEDIFSWTYRTNTAPSRRLIELRTGDAGNAMEHYGDNVGWFNRMPPNGTWFHVAVIRDGATGLEKLYANGVLVGTVTYPALNILTNGIFILGATQNSARNGFEQFLSGAVGALRVHAGQLTSAQVVNNYLEERNVYSAAAVWTGAADTELDWNTAGNWMNSNVGGTGDDVYIGNGGIAKLTSDAGTLASLNIWSGGINLTNDAGTARILVNSTLPVDVGQGGNVTFNLTEGTFQTSGSGTEPALRLGYRNDGFTTTAIIGGSDDPALLLTQGRTVFIGDTDHTLSPGAVTARLNLLASGSMIVSNNNLYVGNAGADGKITVDGGTLLLANSNPATRNYIFVSSNNGKGELVLNSGEINTPGIGEIQVGSASATGEGILRVNGGKIYTSRIWTGGNTWNMKLYLNGGEIYNSVGQNSTDFIGQFKNAYIQAGGAKIVVPIGTAPIATQRFEHDPDLGATADGGLTLSGGGMLTLASNTNTFTGPITISGGTALHLTNQNPFMVQIPSITLNNGSIGWKKAGGFTNLLAKLTPDSTGSIVLYPENASENINLTGFTNITVRFQGTFTYTGTITLDPSVTALVFTPENGSVVNYSPVLTGTQPIIVNGIGNGMVDLTGDNNAWTGSITVNGGRLSVSHVNGLGTGAITINSNTTLRINVALAPSFTSRITSDSKGYISLQAPSAAVNIDLTGCPGVYLGTDVGTLNYAGTITPTPDGVYRLGGGNTAFRFSANQGFVANLTGGVDTVIMQGMARITNSTCTGNMIITNNGVLHLTTDAAFGVVPAAPTNNILLDTGGAIRLGNGSVTLNANRGITVGSGGGEIHSWGAQTLTVPGNLSGAGKLNFTDGGATVFSGINSAYTGILDIQAGSTIIGNGTTFSWNTNAKVTGINGANSRFGINANANLAWATDFGASLGSADLTRNNFSLLKRGTGTLTVDVAQSYLQDTDIEGGTVKVANAAAIPSGPGKGNVDFANNAVLDVNGYNIIVNGLTGVGRVIDSASAATQITVGTNNNTWTLAAQITNALAIIKTGTGTMTTSHRLQVTSNVLHVTAGTLAVPATTLIDRSLTLSGTGSTLALNTGNVGGAAGLTAYYYYAVAGSNQIVAYATMQNRLNTIAPSAVASSLVAGNTCDYSTNKLYNGDTYLLLHHGLFNAETNGTYTFGLSSDDGSTLFIDGALIVNNNMDQGWLATPQKTGSVFLTQGLHEVMMGMYENAGGQGLTLFCQTPSQGSLTPLPNSLLLPDATRITQLSGTGKIEAIGTTNVTPFEVVANTASTFSGTIVATQGIYIVKSGAAKQTLTLTANCPSSTVFSVRSGELEFSTQPNRGEVMVSSGATASLTATTGSGTVSGISGAGTYALNNTLAQEFLNDLGNRTFSGSLQGVSGSRLSKIGPATWKLTGNGSAFAGTLIVTNGVLDLAGTASLGGSISNNATVTLNVTEDRTFTMSAGGKGALIKNENSIVTLKLNGAVFEQQLTINAGQVLFDNQGNDVVMTKQPVINGTGSWGVVGAGKTTLGATNAVVAVATIKIDTGTLGLGTANPVQDGLISQIDATALSTLTLSGTNVVRWNSLVAGQAYTNAGVINAPYFDPAAFGGRGGVVFGAPNTETHLQSVLNQVGKTVILVARFTGNQQDNGGVWGQTGNDKGLRTAGAVTQYRVVGINANDFMNGGGKAFTNGYEITTQTSLGTTPHIASFYAGSDGTWAGSISTTIGCYWYSAQPTRFVKAEIGEMIVYNRVITDAERLQIEQYLRLKWMEANSTIVNYLPEGASLSLTNNGTLNLGKTTQTFGSITGSGAITNGYAIVRDDIRPGGTGVIGTLGFAGFEQQTATYYADLSQNVGAPCDQVNISGTGSVSLDGLTVNINPLTLPGAITRFKVMSTLGTFTGAPTLTAATSYWTAVIGDSGKSLYLIYSSGTMILFK